MLTQQINQVTRITLRKVPTDNLTNELVIERDIGAKDGTWVKTQMFFNNNEMLHLEDTIATYNQMFVDPQVEQKPESDVIDI